MQCCLLAPGGCPSRLKWPSGQVGAQAEPDLGKGKFPSLESVANGQGWEGAAGKVGCGEAPPPRSAWAGGRASIPSPPWRQGPPGAWEEGWLKTASFHLEALFIWPGMEKGWGQSAHIPMETAMSLAPQGPWPWQGMGLLGLRGLGSAFGSSSSGEVRR